MEIRTSYHLYSMDMHNWTLKQIGAWLEEGAYWNDKKNGWNTGSFEDVDFLLKRNWFMDEDDIYELLNTADDETYWKIVDNRKNYSLPIRMILAPEDYRIDPSLLRMKVVDLDTLPNNGH